MATKKLKTKITRLETIAEALEQNDLDLEKIGRASCRERV